MKTKITSVLVVHTHACRICSKSLFHRGYLVQAPERHDEYEVAQRRFASLCQVLIAP